MSNPSFFKKFRQRPYALVAFVIFAALYELVVFSWCKSTIPLDSEAIATPWLDTKDSGNSQAVIHSDKNLYSIAVTLGDKAKWPNAGIALQSKDKKCIDLSSFQFIDFEIKAQHSTGLTLVALNGQALPVEAQENDRTLYHFFETGPEWQHQSLKLKEFFIPEWLVVEKKLEKKRHELYWDKSCAIAFVASNFTPKNTSEHIEIRNIRFTSFSTFHFALSFALPLILGVLVFRRKKNPTESISIPIHIEIKSPLHHDLEVPNSAPNELERIQSFLASNYQNPDLTTEQIATELKIPARRISEILRQHVNLTPKEYVIQLRIKAASELLKSTDLQIQEIAYQCGFNNVPHFNRQFKTSTGYSPGDFRKA